MLIAFACPRCGASLEADEDCAMGCTTCNGCGEPAFVPLDVPCDDIPALPGAETMTTEELEAIRKGLRR